MNRRIIYRFHALARMAERSISTSEVRAVMETGHVVEAYPDDKPYPSRLMLGFMGRRPLHVVAADADPDVTFVISAYEPDPARWEADFRTRR